MNVVPRIRRRGLLVVGTTVAGYLVVLEWGTAQREMLGFVAR